MDLAFLCGCYRLEKKHREKDAVAFGFLSVAATGLCNKEETKANQRLLLIHSKISNGRNQYNEIPIQNMATCPSKGQICILLVYHIAAAMAILWIAKDHIKM